VTLVHTDLPPGQGVQYEAGWKDNYFEPMQAYFGPALTGRGRVTPAVQDDRLRWGESRGMSA
jgi:hypothetical protein